MILVFKENLQTLCMPFSVFFKISATIKCLFFWETILQKVAIPYLLQLQHYQELYRNHDLPCSTLSSILVTHNSPQRNIFSFQIPGLIINLTSSYTSSHVTLGKSFILSEPVFSLQMKNITINRIAIREWIKHGKSEQLHIISLSKFSSSVIPISKNVCIKCLQCTCPDFFEIINFLKSWLNYSFKNTIKSWHILNISKRIYEYVIALFSNVIQNHCSQFTNITPIYKQEIYFFQWHTERYI